MRVFYTLAPNRPTPPRYKSPLALSLSIHPHPHSLTMRSDVGTPKPPSLIPIHHSRKEPSHDLPALHQTGHRRQRHHRLPVLALWLSVLRIHRGRAVIRIARAALIFYVLCGVSVGFGLGMLIALPLPAQIHP